MFCKDSQEDGKRKRKYPFYVADIPFLRAYHFLVQLPSNMSSHRRFVSWRKREDGGKLHLRVGRNLRAVLSVAILAVTIAVITTAFRTTFFILAEQTSIVQAEHHTHATHLASYIDILSFSGHPARYGTDRNIIRSTPIQLQTNNSIPDQDFAGNKLVLVLDFWERMINVQSALRRLVQLGVDSGFTVIEPFIYESKVSTKFAFPVHFEERNMTPQTAALYFKTDDLYLTKRYISHEEFTEKTRLQMKEPKRLFNATSERGTYPNTQHVIQAVVYIDWSGNRTNRGTISTGNYSLPFYWCDQRLESENWERTPYGYLLGRHFHVQRALCLSSSATVAPARFGPRLFQSLFEFVEKGTPRLSQNCEKCVTVAFMNYRKHAFTGFVSHSGSMPFRQKAPPLDVGAAPQALAERMRKELLRERPYLAIHLRTGKAYALLENYEKRLLSEGINITTYDSFKTWLGECTRKLVSEAREAARELGPRAVYYIASDMYNDGWKGGEKCPPTVRAALDTAKSYLDRELKRVLWFNPKEFGITQDAMGISGLADAAMCLKADRFMFAVPSNFGRWIHEQRASRNKGKGTRRVDCTDPRFEGKY